MKKLKIVKLILSLVSVLFFTVSCASNKVEQTSNIKPVFVTNSKKVNLLPANSMYGSEDNVQLLNGSYGDTNFSLIVYFQCDQNGIFMSLLNDFGTDMGSLSYDGKNVDFESSVFPENLPAEYILNDIQNVYYKAEDLKTNYKKSGLTFEEEFSEDQAIRYIKNWNTIIEKIVIQNCSVEIENYLRGYRYTLMRGEE